MSECPHTISSTVLDLVPQLIRGRWTVGELETVLALALLLLLVALLLLLLSALRARVRMSGGGRAHGWWGA